MWCHSQPVGYRKICHETAFHTMCNVTHNLLVIRKDDIRLPLTTCAISLTACLSYANMWWDSLSQNVQCHHSLAVVIGKDVISLTGFHQICNVTHNLLVIGKDVIRLPFTKCAMSLTFCWSWIIDVMTQICNITYSLLVIAKDVMRICIFHKICNITDSLLVREKDVMRLPFSQNVQCHSLPVGHRKRCDWTSFHTSYAMPLTSCWS